MEKHELAFGEVHVAVALPEVLTIERVTVAFRPKTREEFEGVVAALGGIETLRMPKRMGGYYDEPAYADGPGGSPRISAMVYPPPSSEASEARPEPHPFFGEYVERQSS